MKMNFETFLMISHCFLLHANAFERVENSIAKIIDRITRAEQKHNKNFDVQVIVSNNKSESTDVHNNVYLELSDFWPVTFYNEKLFRAKNHIDNHSTCTIHIVLLALIPLEKFINWVNDHYIYSILGMGGFRAFLTTRVLSIPGYFAQLPGRAARAS